MIRLSMIKFSTRRSSLPSHGFARIPRPPLNPFLPQFFLAFLLTFLLSSSIFAQQGLSHIHPNLARGSAPDRSTEKYGPDAVNTFNGNLHLSIPLGISYPLSQNFSYEFSLTYNSGVWDIDQPSGAVAAMPIKNSNAGLGWDISFGRLIPPYINGSQVGKWVYVGPDGSMHAFYSTLHYDLAESDPQDNYLYTRDGSYYRLATISSTQRFVEAPDGTQSLFQLINGEWKLAQIGDRFNNRLWFTYSTPNVWVITDNQGRTQTIYFKADPAGYYPAVVDRVVLAAFNGSTATYSFAYSVASVTRPTVDTDPATSASINLPVLTSVAAPDGSQYLFTYQPTTAAADSSGRLASLRLPTMGRIEWTYQYYNFTSGTNPTTLSQMLRKTTGVATRKLINSTGGVDGTWTYTPSLKPAGTEERELSNTVTTPLGDKTVYYFSVNTTADGPEWNKADYGLPLTKNGFDRPRSPTTNVASASNGATATASNTLNASYPASAAINGDRKGLNYGNGGVWVDGSVNYFPDWLEVDFSGSKIIDRINVFTLQDTPNNPAEPTPDMTFTQNGIKDFDVQYWNGTAWATVPNGSIVGNNLVWRALTFSPITTSKIRVVVNKANLNSQITEVEAFASALPTETRFLSKEVYDCDGTGGNCQLVRSTYVRYEQDQGLDPATVDVASTNRREASSRVLYNDDVENGATRFADLDRSNFDGLGHYRQTATNGNFGSANVRTVTINYDAATGNYPSAGYAMPLPTGAWVLNTFSQQIVSETTQSAFAKTMDFCFDHNTGFLKRIRQWSSASPYGAASSNDVLAVYTPDTFGQVAVAQYYGGDIQAIGTGSLCSLTLPGSDQYQVRYSYSAGVRNSARYYDATGAAFGPKFIDLDMDRNTGLVSASRDNAGISTQYTYDSMGRQTWIKPEAGHGAWRQFDYTPATAADSAKKFTYDKSNGGASVLTYNAEVYDSFGRVWWEQTAVPGSYPSRYTYYNAMGWVTQKSEFSNDTPKYTELLNYDPFGRPRTVRPPDGAQHDTSFQYIGVSTIRKTSQVATTYNNGSDHIFEVPRTTTSFYDRQGRLWKQTKNWIYNTSRPDITTVYYYDVSDHQLQTIQNDVLVGYLYAYDGRGFRYLASDGYGQSDSYHQFDALGKAHTQRHNANPDLSLTYDRAARLTKVQELNNPAKVWKEFTYADANAINDWRAGKLWVAKRYNYMPYEQLPYVTTETHTYGGVGGRESRYEIELGNGVSQSEKFAQTFTYDETGKPAQLGYPNSTTTGGGDMGRDRTVTNNYVVGYLASVTGATNAQAESWATAISYHGNGLVKQVSHANGVTDNIAADPNGLIRIASVSTAGVKRFYPQIDDNLNTGTFYYDGEGTLVKTGNETSLPSTDPAYPTTAPVSLPAPFSSTCPFNSVDPFGAVYVGTSGGDCNPLLKYFYTADDQIVRVDDARSGYGSRVWYFYDTDGQLMTTYTRTLVGGWVSTLDYIYRGKVLLLNQEFTPGTGAKVRHLHIGFGATGIETDQDGYKIRD